MSPGSQVRAGISQSLHTACRGVTHTRLRSQPDGLAAPTSAPAATRMGWHHPHASPQPAGWAGTTHQRLRSHPDGLAAPTSASAATGMGWQHPPAPPLPADLCERTPRRGVCRAARGKAVPPPRSPRHGAMRLAACHVVARGGLSRPSWGGSRRVGARSPQP